METSLAPAHTRVYRALAHHFERFLLAYDERFQATHGYLRRCMEPAVYRYLDCGIFDQGVARIRCPDCRHEFLVAFSCKLRGLCPSCHQKRELLWVAWAEQELLNFHPHVHILVTDGGFHPIGSFHHLPHFNSRHLERLFRAEVLRMLVDKGLISEETVRNLLERTDCTGRLHGSAHPPFWASTRHRQLGCAGIHRPRRGPRSRPLPADDPLLGLLRQRRPRQAA